MIKKIKIPELNQISKTRKMRDPDSPPPAAGNGDADCELFWELKKRGWPDIESYVCLFASSGCSPSPPSFLDHQRFDPLSNLGMSAWQHLLFVLMLLINTNSSFRVKSSLKNGCSQGLIKEQKFDIDKCGSYGSLVDLEEENSDLQPDFPSMSYKRSTLFSNIQELNSRISGDVEDTAKCPFDVDVDMKEFHSIDDADEPLFWTSALKSAWISDPGSNFFAMSPPKKGIEMIGEKTADLLKVEEVNLDEVNTDEPLVWYSDHKFDWSPEVAWNLFNMSPSKRKRGEVLKNQNKLEYFKVDKNSSKMMVDLEDLKPDELFVWPSDQKLDWNSEEVFNLFTMSPLKRRQTRDAGMGDEPLFWPSDSAFDWEHEAARNFFAMSPRRGKKISFESSTTREVEVKASQNRNRRIGGVRESPRVVELRNGSAGSKGVTRTKSIMFSIC